MLSRLNWQLIWALILCLPLLPASAGQVKSLHYTILKTKPHNQSSFTQGLALKNGQLFETSGLYRHSFVSVYQASNDTVLRKNPLPPQIFAEGLTLYKNQLYVLTWQAGLLYILDPHSLSIRKTLTYSGQGWGITHDDTYFYVSDGSNKIQVRDLATYNPRKQLTVTYPGSSKKLDRLNELEYGQKRIWANRWLTNMIYAINPNTGEVTGELDLTRLVPYAVRSSKEKVLNGIAYDPKANAFWVTGKNWPVRYLLRIE